MYKLHLSLDISTCETHQRAKKLLPAGPCNKVVNTSRIIYRSIHEHTLMTAVTLLPGEAIRCKRKRNYLHTFYINNLNNLTDITIRSLVSVCKHSNSYLCSTDPSLTSIWTVRYVKFVHLKVLNGNLKCNTIHEIYNTYVHSLCVDTRAQITTYRTTEPFTNHAGNKRTNVHGVRTYDHADQHD